MFIRNSVHTNSLYSGFDFIKIAINGKLQVNFRTQFEHPSVSPLVRGECYGGIINLDNSLRDASS